MFPELNLRSMKLILGLCYRFLAGDADPAEAPMNRRRLEQLRADSTELSLRLSGLRADLQIARDKAASAEREAEQAEIDLRLFNEQHPPPPDRRTIFGTRPGREEREIKAQREQNLRLYEMAQTDLGTALDKVKALEQELSATEEGLAEIRNGQQDLAGRLRGEYAAAALEHCTTEQWEKADLRIRELREVLRGDAAVAVLTVIASFLQNGVQAGRQALMESRGILENNPPQVRRVLEALLSYAAGGEMDRSALGMVLPGQLDWEGLYGLYQCIAALCGWRVDGEGLGKLEQNTLSAVSRYVRRARDLAGEDEEAAPENGGEADEAVCLALEAHVALLEEEPQRVLDLAGIAETLQADKGEKKELPRLLDHASGIGFPAWPEAYREEWHVLLCCQVLFAAKGRVPQQVFDGWIRESYGWPKSDFYWWVLARAKDDPGLERNIGGKDEMIVLPARI